MAAEALQRLRYGVGILASAWPYATIRDGVVPPPFLLPEFQIPPDAIAGAQRQDAARGNR